MFKWDTTIPEQFRIKLFLDTNILCFLVDNTHPTFTMFIKELSKSNFCDLISSNYVLHEFIGVRKREHFLRMQVQGKGIGDRAVNLGSLLSYKNDWKFNGVDYLDVKDDVIKEVEKEIITIVSDFNVTYESNHLHNGLINPTKELCLNSKISKEDSLVACSSVFPKSGVTEKVKLVTKDKEFSKFLGDEDSDKIFSNHKLEKPSIWHIRDKIKVTRESDGQSKEVDLLKDTKTEKEIKSIVKQWILNLLCKNKFFLGKSFKPKTDNKEIFYFKLMPDKELYKDKYFLIFDKDLQGFYSINEKLVDFWNNGKIENYPFKIPVTNPEEKSSNISIKLQTSPPSKIKSDNNLVFYHPDSMD